MTFRPVHQCFHRHVSRRKAPMVMMVTRGGRAWRRVRVVLALFRGMLSMVVAYIQGEMSHCLHLPRFPHNCCLLHFCLLHPHCCHLLLIRLHSIRSEERAAICARRTGSMRVSQVQEYRLHQHMAQPVSRVLLLLLLLRFPGMRFHHHSSRHRRVGAAEATTSEADNSSRTDPHRRLERGDGGVSSSAV